MNTVAPQFQATSIEHPVSPDYFSATDIARAIGLAGEAGKKMVKRTATMENWPRKFCGNKLVFVPPPAIAELIVTPPAQPNEENKTPAVRFCDLAHSATAREMVLLRNEAVQMVHDNIALGKEVALKLVVGKMAADHPLLRIGVSSLRQWCDKYAAAGIDGLVEQKRGVVGRKPFAAQLDEEHLLAAAAGSVERGVKGRLNIARGYRDTIVNNPLVPDSARLLLHNEHAAKQYVPRSVRDAIRDRANPLTTTLIQIGPKAARLDGPYTECSYDNLKAGQAFTADDMTANCYVWCEWPNEAGFLLIRPQILAVMDVGSMSWLNLRAVMRPKAQYNKDDVWGLIGDLFDDYGLFETAILEGGIWQSNVVRGHNTGLDDEARFGGLKSLGVNLIHTRSPRGKIIEPGFNQLQYAADNVRGFCGRNERKDCPEIVRQQLAQVKAGHAHPREFFLHIDEYSAHLQKVMKSLNHERGDGKILRGIAPADKWAEDAPVFKQMADEAKWMYRASYSVVTVTKNGVRIRVGSGKYETHYSYSNPVALAAHRGRRIVAYWNDYDPDTDAVIYSLRNGKPDKFLCVASRIPDLNRLGASREQLDAEAARKKLSMQHARTQRKSLAPYLQRQQRVITPDSGPDAVSVGTRIEAAKTDNTVRQRHQKAVRYFVGDASALLDSTLPSDNIADVDPVQSSAENEVGSRTVKQSLTPANGKVTYKLKPTSGSDAVTPTAEYVDYLLQRLTEFRKAGTSFGQHHAAAVTVAITAKIAASQLKCDLHDESRFEYVCTHLKENIDATILGKNNTSKGRPNYHEFEPITDLSPAALLG